MAQFKDHFSAQSGTYAEFRPVYPAGLFRFLSSLCSGHEFCWDVATGNGQAAATLAEFFSHVYATDASANQIAEAKPHPRISYYVEGAEKTALKDQSCDLITVAQAIHWFRHDAFYTEVRRVLKPGGILAIWGYGLHTVSPEVDHIVEDFYSRIVGPYWPPERRYIEQKYAGLPFPFAEITAPAFEISAQYSLSQLMGYLQSWSATQRYIKENGNNPLNEIQSALKPAWGAQQVRTLRWPIYTKIARV